MVLGKSLHSVNGRKNDRFTAVLNQSVKNIDQYVPFFGTKNGTSFLH